VFTDALKYIDQVGVGINALELAGHQQALDKCNTFGPDLGPVSRPGESHPQPLVERYVGTKGTKGTEGL
jgi:hypothetical protein